MNAPHLRRSLGLRDLVLFNVVAVLGLRWLATSARTGPSAIVLWLLAAAFFFVPQGLVVSELSSRFPDEGGIYAWTRRAFGEGHGFLCGWCYWICNVLYYPNLLISTAVIGTYAIGQGGTGLADRWSWVLSVTLGALWLAVGLNVRGVGTGKWLQNLGGIGTYLPGVMLIVLAAVALVMGAPSANLMPAASFVPDVRDLSTLNLWASIAFAFAGLELSATMGGEVRDARRTLPRAVLIAAPLIAVAYVAGTTSVLRLVPLAELNIVSGFLQAIDAGARALGDGFAWLAVLAAAGYTIGTIGGVGAWLTGPARVAFVIGLDRYFPPAFGKVHPRWGTPWVAIVVQAALATLFLLLSVLGKGTDVERAYLILLDTQLLIYFIPYLYLFASYVKLRGVAATTVAEGEGAAMPPRAAGPTMIIAAAGAGMTLFAMLIATVPPEGGGAGLFFTKVVGGAAAFIVAGGAVYWRARSRVVAAR